MDMKSRNSNNQSVLRFRSYQLTSVRNRIRQKNINEKMSSIEHNVFCEFCSIGSSIFMRKILACANGSEKMQRIL